MEPKETIFDFETTISVTMKAVRRADGVAYEYTHSGDFQEFCLNPKIFLDNMHDCCLTDSLIGRLRELPEYRQLFAEYEMAELAFSEGRIPFREFTEKTNVISALLKEKR